MKYGKRYAYTVIAVIAVVTVFFGFMIPKINMDNELRHFFPEEHPSNIRFKQLTKDFGDQYAMDIVLETNEDTILRPDYITAIKNISEELALLDNVVKVRSLTDMLAKEETALKALQNNPQILERFKKFFPFVEI